jgi:hypothetical protein
MGRKKIATHTRSGGKAPPPSPAALELKVLIKSGAELVGREPTVRVTDAGCTALMLLASEGADMWTMAHKVGIGRTTLQRLIKDDERVEAAIAIGKAALSDELTNHLLVAARKGNIVASIYLTKARLGWREGDVPEAKPNIIINLPDSQTPEAYLKSISVIERESKGNQP